MAAPTIAVADPFLENLADSSPPSVEDTINNLKLENYQDRRCVMGDSSKSNVTVAPMIIQLPNESSVSHTQQARIEVTTRILSQNPTSRKHSERQQTSIFQSESLYDEQKDQFDISMTPITDPSSPLFPKQVKKLHNFETLVGKSAFQHMTLTVKSFAVVPQYLGNEVNYAGMPLEPTIREFEKLFTQDGVINVIVRDRDGHAVKAHEAVQGLFRKDVTDGDMYRQYYPQTQRSRQEPPLLRHGQLLAPELRPDHGKVRLLPSYPSFHAYSTQLACGVQQLHEYEQLVLRDFEMSTGHSVKVLRLKGAGNNRYTGIFQFKQSKDGQRRWKEGDVFRFCFHPEDKLQSPRFKATVNTSRGIGIDGEVVAFIDRERQLPPATATAEESAKIQPYYDYPIEATRIISSNPDDNATVGDTREAMNKAKSIPIDGIKVQTSSGKTYKRQMNAICDLQKGTQPVKSAILGVPNWEDTPRVKDVLHPIICGKQTGRQTTINAIQGAENYLEHLQDPDQVAISTFCQQSPDAFILINSPAGSGKANHLANVARALCIKHLVADQDALREDCNYSRTPVGIVASAPSNAACDVIVEKLEDTLYNSNDLGTIIPTTLKANICIIRAHPQYFGPHMLQKFTPSLKRLREEALPVNTKVKYSLEYRMLQNAGLTFETTDLTDMEMFRNFRGLHRRLVDGELDQGYMTYYNDAFEELRDYTVANADIIVTTHIDSAASMYKDSFKAKYIMLDEASLASVSDTLVVLNSYPDCAVFMFGDRQLKPIVAGPRKLEGCMPLLEHSLFTMLLDRQWPHVTLEDRSHS